MDAVQSQNFHFSKLTHLSSRIVRFNWQKIPLGIAVNALREIEWTWHCFVQVNLKLWPQNDACREKLCRAHETYVKCKNCIQSRISQITAATEATIKSEVKQCEPELAQQPETGAQQPNHERRALSGIPMVQIPMPIVVDFLRMQTNQRNHACQGARIVNEQPAAGGSDCMRCSKSIKNANFVNCSNCETKGHFGCLRKAKLLRSKGDTHRWRCQQCLTCYCCTGTFKSVKKLLAFCLSLNLQTLHFHLHFGSISFATGDSVRMQFMPKCIPFALFATSHGHREQGNFQV